MPEHMDVLIVGAGLSGVGAAYYLQTRCPDKTYTIFEARDVIGGTWDLFRYPGVRSDSDMFTLGYSFRPWPGDKAIADGPSILKYIRNTASIYGIDKHIRFGHRVKHASWSSADARWTVQVERALDGAVVEVTCNFLYMCSGYYDYEKGYTPDWPDFDRFEGQIVHPQQWPEDLEYRGRRVVVIGSGATAVTLVPAMADEAEHVVMLQRSPSYILSSPAQDAIANGLRRVLPARMSYLFARWKAILTTMLFYYFSRWRPQTARRMIVKLIQDELGPDYDTQTHFTPSYNPWDQRLCLVPDADLFQAIKSGKVSMVTDHIERFTTTGIRLRSGRELEADIIVTATGLVMKLMSGVQAEVDGEMMRLSDKLNYKGMMFNDVPNFAFAFGYTNASWTLKCELTSQYVCRLLNYMDEHGYDICVPRVNDASIEPIPAVNFTSGYVERARDSLPHQGSKPPWKLYQNYLLDLMALRLGSVEDGAMTFLKREEVAPPMRSPEPASD